MQIDDMILVSVDDHVVEPAHLFEGRLPAKYVDVAPKFVHLDNGTDVWTYEGNIMPNIGLNAVSGRPPEEYGMEPTSLEEIRTGCYDINDRIRDMDANGVLGSMNFPSFVHFAGQLFARTDDKDQAIAMVRAYNDWHIDEWCGTHPGRMIPLMIPPIWDPELLAAEVKRNAAKDCHAVTFSENPSKLGYPSLHSDHWDPFWKACEDEGTVVCLHIGSSSQLMITAPDAPMDVLISLQPINLVQAAADLIWSPIFRKFPNLTFALSEGGIGWIPYVMERIDSTYEKHHRWTGQDFGDKLPSQVFHEHVVTCFIEDPFGIESRHHLNMDNITWECDYPHSDSTWPTSPEALMKSLDAVPGGVPDDEIRKITYENAMRIFQFDPFASIPKDQCTVGALRAKAAGWDISQKSFGTKARGTLATDLAAQTSPAHRSDS